MNPMPALAKMPRKLPVLAPEQQRGLRPWESGHPSSRRVDGGVDPLHLSGRLRCPAQPSAKRATSP